MQIDPINSPHPVPWSWILAAHGAAAAASRPQTHYYRSASLRSPDQQWVAYSRICLQVTPELHTSQVSSVLMVENLSTGSLQGIQPALPLDLQWDQPLDASGAPSSAPAYVPSSSARMAGEIDLVIPISWDRRGDRLLARNFRGAFCSSFASDYALIWDSHTGAHRTLAPGNVAYEYAVLQGWSQNYPDQVLFKTAKLGDRHQHLWRVNDAGYALPSAFDEAEVLGQIIATPLEGPQAIKA